MIEQKGEASRPRPLLFRCLEVIFYIFPFEQFEVAAHPCEKWIAPACCAVVCLSRVSVYVLFVVVAEFQLIPQQVLVALVWLFFDIERDEEKIFRRNHIVESENAIFPAVNAHNMYIAFQLFVVRLRRFHRDEVFVPVDFQNNADVGAAFPFIKLHAVVLFVQKFDKSVSDSIYSQLFHGNLFL